MCAHVAQTDIFALLSWCKAAHPSMALDFGEEGPAFDLTEHVDRCGLPRLSSISMCVCDVYLLQCVRIVCLCAVVLLAVNVFCLR